MRLPTHLLVATLNPMLCMPLPNSIHTLSKPHLLVMVWPLVPSFTFGETKEVFLQPKRLNNLHGLYTHKVTNQSN